MRGEEVGKVRERNEEKCERTFFQGGKARGNYGRGSGGSEKGRMMISGMGSRINWGNREMGTMENYV